MSDFEEWNGRGALATGVAEILAASGIPTLVARARRITSCTRFLRVSAGGSSIWPAFACGDAICPCCRVRRARIASKYINGLPRLLASHQGAIISACFTVRNVHPSNLRLEIARINTAFTAHFLRAMTYLVKCAPSYVRKLEVTRAPDGMAHPHIHGMFALPPHWTDRRSLLEIWRRAARLPYAPDVDYSDVPPAEAISVLRYVLKQPLSISRAMLTDPDFVLAAATSLSGIRTTSAGGLFRQCAVRGLENRFACRALDGVRLQWTNGGYQPTVTARKCAVTAPEFRN